MVVEAGDAGYWGGSLGSPRGGCETGVKRMSALRRGETEQTVFAVGSAPSEPWYWRRTERRLGIRLRSGDEATLP
jgi:hypothetical protein